MDVNVGGMAVYVGVFVTVGETGVGVAVGGTGVKMRITVAGTRGAMSGIDVSVGTLVFVGLAAG